MLAAISARRPRGENALIAEAGSLDDVSAHAPKEDRFSDVLSTLSDTSRRCARMGRRRPKKFAPFRPEQLQQSAS
jgi:hypothetical protein